jgi:IclR family acetate operon transcriptional repressor
VYNNCSEPLAAISVSGMTSRLTDERLPVIGRTVHEVAAELTVALGGVIPMTADNGSAKREADSTFSSR